jgi:putative ABC transport system permease protein
MASALVAVALAMVPALVFRRSRVTARPSRPDSPSHLRLRHLIVSAQIALALTLLTGAGLLVRSLWRLYDFPAGFDPERILVMRVDFPGQPSRDDKRTMTFELLARVQALPGVTAATINSQGDRLSLVRVEGAPPPAPGTEQAAAVSLNMTSAAFAPVMGLRMVRGRWFTDAETHPVVVVNESLATRAFGRRDPLGERLQIPSLTGDPKDVRFAPIVGVVADLKFTKLDEAALEEIYVPFTHLTDHTRINLLVRTERSPLSLVAPILQAISAVASGQAPFEVMTLADALTDSIRPRRFNLLLLATFAGAALLLSLVGIYGLVAYAVGQRTHEIGVRMALGARQGHVLRLVIGEGLRLTIAGVCIGAAAASMVTRLMASMLYEVAPTDPPTFVTTTLILVVTALMACAIPAAKAARVDPVQALRHE